MSFLSEISVEGLFGLYDHHLRLRRRPPVTIVAGPNGIGKTTLLALTNALLSGSYRRFARQNFSTLTVTADSGRSLRATVVERMATPRGDEAVLHLTQERRGQPEHEAQLLVPLAEGGLPPWIQPFGDMYYDERRDTYMTAEEAARWARLRGSRMREQEPDPPEWFRASDWSTEFVETKRLDSLIAAAIPGRARDVPKTPIDYYLDVAADAMGRARGESSDIAQTRDRTFANRMLDPASRATVKEADIRHRYSMMEQKADELRGNGLLADSLEVLPDKRLKPTDRWVLRLFLQDFEAKLQPLEPVSARLNLMRRIVDAKFLNKYMDVAFREGTIFRSNTDDERIPADALSSGEQHEIALLSKLLFDVSADTTVLIDEPELSLHVSWQHRMLDDLEMIAQLVGLRVVVATHSTAIINGRWDLVEELGAIDDTQDGE